MMKTSKIENLKDYDQFAANPEEALLFNEKKQYPTMFGLIVTFFIVIFTGVLWYTQFNQMFIFGNNSNASFTTEADMITVYNVSQIGSFPLYGMLHDGYEMKKYDAERCKEFDGDCLKWVDKHFEIYFQ